MLKFVSDVDAEIDKCAHLCWWMLARWMESEKREALTMPVRKEINQRSSRQRLPNAPADHLSNTGSREAFIEHRLRVGERQRSCRRNIDGLASPDEFPFERLPGIGVKKLQASMSDKVPGMLWMAVALQVARRGHSQDRRFYQFARNQSGKTRLAEPDCKIDPLGNKIADMLSGYELDRKVRVTFAKGAKAACKNEWQKEGIDVHFKPTAYR